MEPSGFLSEEELRAVGFASLGSNVRIDRSVRFFGASRISIGSNVRIDAFSILSAGEGGIVIGNHVHIAVYVFMSGAARIEMKDFSGVSGRVSVYSSNDDYLGNAMTGPTLPDRYRKLHSAPVTIGRHGAIGASSIILPGVTVHDGGCVGAMTLVKSDVPEFTIVADKPERVVIRRRRRLLQLEADFLQSK